MAVALIAVPGIALAEENPPGGSVQDPTVVLDELVGGVPSGTEGGTEGGDESVEDETGGADTGGDDAGTGDTPAPPALETPDPLLEGLKELTRALGIPDSCVDGISDGIELILNGLLDPAQLEAILEELTGLLGDFEGTLEELLAGLDGGLDGGLGGAQEMQLLAAEADAIEAPEGAPGADVIAGIELIVTTLAEECVPEEEPEQPAPVAPVGGGTPQAPAPAPQVQEPVAQPVSYPGYAPTGADKARADDVSVPLTALGGGLVLVAAGAAGYGVRGRALRTRD